LPRVSVVTPSFNQGHFLEETLRSVLAQRADIHEYFVLDGGSTDGSRELIEANAGHLDFWSSERDGGQAEAIDRGFRMATGDVLYWLNSDDVLLPGAIGRVKANFAAGASVVTGWDYLIDASSRIMKVRRPPRQTLAAALWGVTHISQATCFFRRDVYLEAGGLDTRLGCVLDTELWLRMLQVAPSWDLVGAFQAAFRVHPAQKGNSWLEAYAREHADLELRYPEYFQRSTKHMLGLWSYRAKELARGRYLRDYLESRRLQLTPIDKVGHCHSERGG
jgi:glycosyltransferase involved in cell wall biosynthesis